MSETKYEILSSKKEFIAIDFLKLILAVFVVSIHFPPFSDINEWVSYTYTDVFCSLAVPIFFIISGFFWSPKSTDKRGTGLYLKRMIQLYALYTVIYTPCILISYIKSGDSILTCVLDFIKDIFISGTYLHFWYFAGLIISVGILYALINLVKINDKQIGVICVALYLLSIILPAFESNKICSAVYEFLTPRNGLFNIIFVFVGYLLGKYRDRIKNRKNLIPMLISVILFVILGIIFRNVSQNPILAILQISSMQFMKLIASSFVFVFVAFIGASDKKQNIGKQSRKLSTLIYTLHLIVSFCIFAVTDHILHIHIHSLIYFFIVLIATAILSVMIIWLSEKEKFKFMKYLY